MRRSATLRAVLGGVIGAAVMIGIVAAVAGAQPARVERTSAPRGYAGIERDAEQIGEGALDARRLHPTASPPGADSDAGRARGRRRAAEAADATAPSTAARSGSRTRARRRRGRVVHSGADGVAGVPQVVARLHGRRRPGIPVLGMVERSGHPRRDADATRRRGEGRVGAGALRRQPRRRRIPLGGRRLLGVRRGADWAPRTDRSSARSWWDRAGASMAMSQGPADRWRHDEHGHENGHAVARAARCRQPRPDPRAGRTREQPQGRQRRDSRSAG